MTSIVRVHDGEPGNGGQQIGADLHVLSPAGLARASNSSCCGTRSTRLAPTPSWRRSIRAIPWPKRARPTTAPSSA
ncbi:hypothetical protein LP420_39745 [Massilia sp. B-10]|nr:hypothetical protein LP420_39745 [Massilia sp. B-10]